MGEKITAESGQPTNQSPFGFHSSTQHISASLIDDGFAAVMCLMWSRMYLIQYVIIIINSATLSVTLSLISKVKYGSQVKCASL